MEGRRKRAHAHAAGAGVIHGHRVAVVARRAVGRAGLRAHTPLAGEQPPAIRQAEDGVGQTTPAQRSICAAKRACLRVRLASHRAEEAVDIQVRKASFTTLPPPPPPFSRFFCRAPWICWR